MTSAEGAAELRAAFATEIRRRVSELADAVEAGDAAEVIDLAHRLKGSAYALALPELVAAIEQIELAFRAEPPRSVEARAAVAAARTSAAGLMTSQDAVAELAHALRSPLGVVVGYAALLGDTTLSVEQQAHVEAISSAATGRAGLLDAATGS